MIASIDSAPPLLSLAEEKLLAVFRTLQQDPQVAPKLAGLFLSGTSAAYDPGRTNILLVGKATSKEWYPVNADDGVYAVKQRTRDFIDDGGAMPKSQFWHFARQLGEIAATSANRPAEAWYEHLAWTNLAKIGVVKGNPTGDLFGHQELRCRRLLAAEVEAYRPSLVVFVTNSYQEDVVRDVIGPDQFELARPPGGGNRGAIWFRARTLRFPPFLWCSHPQGVGIAIRQFWLKRARQLLRQ